MRNLLIIFFFFLTLHGDHEFSAETQNKGILTPEEQSLLKNISLNNYVTNWEPFTIHKEKFIDGLSSDLWNKIVATSGIHYTHIKVASFADALQKIEHDKNGSIIATSSTKDREKYGTFTKPYASFPIAITTSIDKEFILDLKELEGKTVAVGKNYTASKLLKKHYPKINLLEVKDTKEALDLVANKKVYAATDIFPALIYYMNQYSFSNLKISGTSKFNFEVKMMVNKNNEKIIPVLNKLIDSLDSTEKQNIINKWVYTKHVTKIDYTMIYIIIVFFTILISFGFYRNYVLKKYQKKLEDSEFRWKFSVEGSGDGLWDWNVKTNEVYFSEQWKNILGYENEELPNEYKTWENIVHPQDKELTISNLTAHLNGTTKIYQSTHRLLCKDGTYKWTLAKGVVVQKDNDNNPLRVIGTQKDITNEKELEIEREKVQELILEQKMEFESIFKFSSDGIAITDLETNFIDFNDAFLNITGFTRNELLLKSSFKLTAQESKEELKEVIAQVIKKGSVQNFQKESIVNNNKHIFVNMSISLLPDKNRLLIISKDITSLKLYEDQTRLASMGEMIGNIAHQWRQPLSIISTGASGIQLKLTYEETIDKDFIIDATNKIVEQTQYLSETIDDFRNFIKEEKRFEEVLVSELIKETMQITDATLKNNFITLVSQVDDDLTILGNKNQLRQAIINIINNAKDFIVQNIQDDKDKYIFIKTQSLKHNELRLTITDTAGGIPSQVLPKIFDPYFTTKHKSIGTGLGLSMTSKIIRERHKFTIEVHNEEFEYNNNSYKGACFQIIFIPNKI